MEEFVRVQRWYIIEEECSEPPLKSYFGLFSPCFWPLVQTLRCGPIIGCLSESHVLSTPRPPPGKCRVALPLTSNWMQIKTVKEKLVWKYYYYETVNFSVQILAETPTRAGIFTTPCVIRFLPKLPEVLTSLIASVRKATSRETFHQAGYTAAIWTNARLCPLAPTNAETYKVASSASARKDGFYL